MAICWGGANSFGSRHSHKFQVYERRGQVFGWRFEECLKAAHDLVIPLKNAACSLLLK